MPSRDAPLSTYMTIRAIPELRTTTAPIVLIEGEGVTAVGGSGVPAIVQATRGNDVRVVRRAEHDGRANVAGGRATAAWST